MTAIWSQPWKRRASEPMAQPSRRDPEAELRADIGSFTHDPLGFVKYAYPWGEVGKGLDAFGGPRDWQADILDTIGKELRRCSVEGWQPIRIAVASGHGIGKSALIAQIIGWALSTFPKTKIIVTANTGEQLRTKTWPEVAKWFNMMICRRWFDFEATSIRAADARLQNEWRADAQTWSEHNTQAFAGAHNHKRRLILIYDEASGIARKVWEVSEGALTDEDTEIIWVAFGNPTEADGRFRECFGSHSKLWITRQIDSRTVPGTNLEEFQRMVDLYGEDSDFVRVRIKGQFPRVAAMQFISSDDVEEARKRPSLSVHLNDPLIMGVDVARFGDDESVIAWRKGRDATIIPWDRLRSVDTMQLAARIADLAIQYKPDAIHIDGGGVGGGVVDRCRQLGMNVREVQFGAKPDRAQADSDPTRYANKRAEMWGYMREALKVITIPDEGDLQKALTGVQYGMNARDEIILESKESMKKRGESSPDLGDALALTYAYPVFPMANAGGPHMQGRKTHQATIEYDPLEGQS